ncbi:MAG: hypothetical protein IPL65_22625 [Lewinellaceae bacterium]|nr:hypothetical protein [Lewinellaceae bacterium]
MSARKVWNQYNYHGVHINDDLTVPQTQQPGNLSINGEHPNNIFLAQASLRDSLQESYLSMPDLAISTEEVICHGSYFSVKWNVCNNGALPFFDTILVSVYKQGNPFAGTAIKMGTFPVAVQPLPVGNCTSFTLNLPFASGNIYAVANDPGLKTAPFPSDYTSFWISECDYTNNVSVFQMNPLAGPALELGPDLVVCSSSQSTNILSAPGFASYLWQDGSTNPVFTATGPGKYWLTTMDACFNIKSDTINIVLADTIEEHLQVNICNGTLYYFGGDSIPAGNTKSFLFQSAAGCDSTIIVQVTGLPAIQSSEKLELCTGDSVLVFGQFVEQPGSYTQTLSSAGGCDSIHTITVQLFPGVENTNELRTICYGDSALIFGTWVQNSGMFTETFNNQYGCDSTHTIQLEVLPTVTGSVAFRTICPGDSTLVFGNWIHSSGQFSQTLSAYNGCDSVVTVNVELLPAVNNSEETRAICSGDSTLVFGNWIKQAGSYAQQLTATNGCDSCIPL